MGGVCRTSKFGPAMQFIFSCRDAMNSLLRVCVKRSAALNGRPSYFELIVHVIPQTAANKRATWGPNLDRVGSSLSPRFHTKTARNHLNIMQR